MTKIYIKIFRKAEKKSRAYARVWC